MPPVVLNLHLTNKSDAPIDVTFDGCDSSLGNFVVTPEKSRIEAGQSVDTDPMRSLLGETGDEIPLNLTIRVAGKTEKKVLTLHLDPTPTPAPFPTPTPTMPPVI
jgi:hypothetical protein